VWKKVAVGTVSLIVLLGCAWIGVLIYNRSTLGVWPLSAAPDRFQFCGVRYYRVGEAPMETVTRVEAMTKTASTTTWRRAATLGIHRWQVYATEPAWSCPEPEGRNGTGHYLFVKLGPDRYLWMSDDN
jgi:hypothetical protein